MVVTAAEMKSENEASTGGTAENHVEIDQPRGSTAEIHLVSDALLGGAADVDAETERHHGSAAGGARGADGNGATETDSGPSSPSRYIDHDTELLGSLAAMWQDFQQMRLSAGQRGLTTEYTAAFAKVETMFARDLKKALRKHPLWPWLSEHPGTGGVHVARLIARIGNPHRFPGQQCDRGHTFAPTHALSSTSRVACPFFNKEKEQCPGRILPPRTATGVRALWRYFGLDGDRDHAASGHRYDRLGKTALLQPEGGIAAQIVRLRIEPWRSIYDTHKTRLTNERGLVSNPESETSNGAGRRSEIENPVGPNGTEAEHPDEIDRTLGLRPFQIDAIARKIAAKAFVGDLLMAWKRITE
jgi:hypothetical protein